MTPNKKRGGKINGKEIKGTYSGEHGGVWRAVFESAENLRNGRGADPEGGLPSLYRG